MQLFYSPDIEPNDTHYEFPQEEAKHMVRVLRKKEGDLIHLTNGKGLLVKLEISLAAGKKCQGKVLDVSQKAKRGLNLHMAVAPTKMNDRYEWFLEKATEIGVEEITPIICARSERKAIKPERFQKIVVSAMKQSLQTYLPRLNPVVTLLEFLDSSPKGQAYIAHCEEIEKTHLKTMLDSESDITVLIGPEGDFSETEIDKATAQGYTPISLGENRLRTETAAIYACNTINIHFS